LSSREASRPDLELFVRRRVDGGRVFLGYTLHCDDTRLGVTYNPFGEKELLLDPFRHFQSLLSGMECREGRPATRIDSQGTFLLRQLLPKDLQLALLDLVGRVAHLKVVSDEPWVPWELLRFPGRRGPGGEEGDGAFWAETFSVIRVLPGSRPQSRLPVRRIGWIGLRGAGLDAARGERELLEELAPPGVEVVDVPAIAEEVLSAMGSGDFDLFHFSCHGMAASLDADQSLLRLADDVAITPVDLEQARRGLETSNPVIFVNACHAGRSGSGLTGLGGWASGFLGAGAGLFVGPLWAIPDSRAAAFSSAFYRGFFGGRPMGEAMLEARLALRRELPGDPTWLAYVAYADPDARFVPKAEREEPPGPGSGDARVEATGVRPVPPGPPPNPSPLLPGGPAPTAVEASAEEPVPAVRTARPPPLRVERGRINAKDGGQLVLVPGGDYVLGADDVGDAARPVHRVRLSPFYIGLHPVTNHQYARFLKACPGHPEPVYWREERFNSPRQPVVGVSWADADAYCRWAGLALPTEAQWEAAARGSDQRRYPWGDDPPTPERANFGGHANAPAPVDAHPAGRGPFGTLDQAGNVWEWCADAWSQSAYEERGEGRLDPCHHGDPGMRVLRGGSWLNPGPDLRAAVREGATARLRQNMQGFRCAWTPPSQD
jgi:formylglycine-generating enzyme required for sulfatase activity